MYVSRTLLSSNKNAFCVKKNELLLWVNFSEMGVTNELILEVTPCSMP